MKNIFNFNTNRVLFPKQKLKKTDELIKEIHESFYTEVDKLLASAKISHSLENKNEHLTDRSLRLKKLGFINTKEVLDAEESVIKTNKLAEENKQNNILIEVINYFSFKYPCYKFITKESVKRLCAKYNLIYGEVDRYKGTVPDKNLRHIEDFKISKEDDCYYERTINLYFPTLDTMDSREERNRYYVEARPFDAWTHTGKCKLEIVAPEKDFDMTGYEIINHQISKIPVPDPIVLYPVCFKNNKYYLIVTAWGIEANDEDVVNPINN